MPLLQKKRYRPVHGSLYTPVPAAGTFSLLSSVTDFAGTSFNPSGNATGAIDTTGAGLLVFGAAYFPTATGLTVADSKGNSWTALTVTNISNAAFNIWYSVPTSVGTGHTVSLTGTNVYATRYFAAFSGGAASPADQQSGTTGTSTTPTGSSITPGFSNELVVSGVAVNTNSLTVSAINGGFTIIGSTFPGNSGNYIGGGMAYLIQTTPAAAAPAWTISSSSQWAVKMASFKVS